MNLTGASAHLEGFVTRNWGFNTLMSGWHMMPSLMKPVSWRDSGNSYPIIAAASEDESRLVLDSRCGKKHKCSSANKSGISAKRKEDWERERKKETESARFSKVIKSESGFQSNLLRLRFSPRIYFQCRNWDTISYLSNHVSCTKPTLRRYALRITSWGFAATFPLWVSKSCQGCPTNSLTQNLANL